MANNNGALSKVNIPKLDKKNFLHWSMQIKVHLRHKGLIKYITKPPVQLAGSAANAVAKKHAKVVNILMTFMSKTTFKEFITPNNQEIPFKSGPRLLFATPPPPLTTKVKFGKNLCVMNSKVILKNLVSFLALNWLKLKTFEKMAQKRLKAFFGRGSRKLSERTNAFYSQHLVMF
jgi:hypothetical protein